jgi:hypothetical protein
LLSYHASLSFSRIFLALDQTRVRP